MAKALKEGSKCQFKAKSKYYPKSAMSHLIEIVSIYGDMIEECIYTENGFMGTQYSRKFNIPLSEVK